MTNHYAYQLHGAYKNLVSDVVHALRGSEWPEEVRVLDALPGIPSGVPDLDVQFIVTKMGSISLSATSGDSVLALWRLEPEVTGINEGTYQLMMIGKMQAAFDRFWDVFHSKCTRIDMNHNRRGVHAPTMNSRIFFTEKVLRLWLSESVGLVFRIRPGEISVGQDLYHTNRSWRRNVRELVGLGAK